MKFTSIVFVLAMAADIVDSAPSTEFSVGNKHPLENRKSWNFHVKRHQADSYDKQREGIIASANVWRFLEAVSDSPPEDERNASETQSLPYSIKRKKPKNHIPFAGGDTTHGMMIDAGSQGTRLHIYEWDKRFLLDEDDLLEVAQGKKLSYPTSNNRWTDKYTPGLDVFSYHKDADDLKEAIGGYLGSLLDFAKTVLKDKEDEWHTYPIYLKGTGGLRTLSQSERVRIIDCVRELFHDKTYNPFDFDDERARVISGEEEAIYGWVGVNFAKGTLIEQSEGVGAVTYNPKLTYGMVEMGGASTQIAVYENNGDLMANLFKLQLGGARHWNVYVHSYLYSGINGAWSRLNARLNWQGVLTNPCLPTGSSIEFSSWMHLNDKAQLYPRSHPESTTYTVTMNNDHTVFDFEKCSDISYKLLRKQTNKEWCDFQMDGNCGFAGVYQPPLPQMNRAIDEFIATSNFADVFAFLQLGERSTIDNIGKKAERICSLSFNELQVYNSNLESPLKDPDVLKQGCFRSVYVYQMLRNGWEFGDDFVIHAADVINGHKLGWALGCMLYEINTLPWNFHPELLFNIRRRWLIRSLYIIVGTLVASGIAILLATRMSKEFNKTVRESIFFRQTGLETNGMVCRLMAIPDARNFLEESEKSYEGLNIEATKKEALAKDTKKGSTYTRSMFKK